MVTSSWDAVDVVDDKQKTKVRQMLKPGSVQKFISQVASGFYPDVVVIKDNEDVRSIVQLYEQPYKTYVSENRRIVDGSVPLVTKRAVEGAGAVSGARRRCGHVLCAALMLAFPPLSQAGLPQGSWWHVTVTLQLAVADAAAGDNDILTREIRFHWDGLLPVPAVVAKMAKCGLVNELDGPIVATALTRTLKTPL